MQPRRRGTRRPNRHARRLARSNPGTYLHPYESVNAGTLVWLWCRVSTGGQAKKGNLDNQEAALRATVEAQGGIVVGMRTYVGKASGAEYEAALFAAANRAARAGAVLLAESTSRFTRHPDYNPKDPRPRRPGATQLGDLPWICGHVRLVTLHDPDATWQDERGYQTERGQRHKGNRGGRPAKPKPGYKKRLRLQAIPKVRWMKWVGMSNRAIARALGTDEKNVRRWGAAFLPRTQADEDDTTP